VPFSLVGTTEHGLDSSAGPASFDVNVVSVVLCKSLFEDCTPDGAVSADVGVFCPISTVVVLHQRQVVVNDDCVGHAESVKVDSVDSLTVQRTHIIEEDLLHAAWHFGDTGGCGEEPAVAENTLSNVIRRNSIAKKTLCREGSFGSLPVRS